MTPKSMSDKVADALYHALRDRNDESLAALRAAVDEWRRRYSTSLAMVRRQPAARKLLDMGFRVPASESVLIQSRSLRAGTPAFDATVTDVVTRTMDSGLSEVRMSDEVLQATLKLREFLLAKER